MLPIRIAATYNINRYLYNKSAFYDQLRNMRIIESDQILSNLEVRQDPDFIQAEALLGTSCAHITDNGRVLTVYVPKNAKAQKVCYLSGLPKAFTEWLGPSFNVREEVAKILTLVFVSDKAILNDVLDDQGIVKLSFEDKDAIETGSRDEEEAYYNVEEPERSKDHPWDLHNDRKDTRKTPSTKQGVFDFHALQSALLNVDNADKILPRKGGLFANY